MTAVLVRHRAAPATPEAARPLVRRGAKPARAGAQRAAARRTAAAAPVGLRVGALGDSIAIQLVIAIEGLGAAGDVLALTETVYVENLIAAGWAVLYIGPVTPIPPVVAVGWDGTNLLAGGLPIPIDGGIL